MSGFYNGPEEGRLECGVPRVYEAGRTIMGSSTSRAANTCFDGEGRHATFLDGGVGACSVPACGVEIDARIANSVHTWTSARVLREAVLDTA